MTHVLSISWPGWNPQSFLPPDKKSPVVHWSWYCVTSISQIVKKAVFFSQPEFLRFGLCSYQSINLSTQIHFFDMANFYRPVRVPAWLWNPEFFTKIRIQKSRCHFLPVWRHKKRFAVILTYVFALSDHFSHFWHVLCQFCDQAEIHWVSYRPIKFPKFTSRNFQNSWQIFIDRSGH